MAFIEGMKCPSLHTQSLDPFECANGMVCCIFTYFPAVNTLDALMQSKRQVFSVSFGVGGMCLLRKMTTLLAANLANEG